MVYLPCQHAIRMIMMWYDGMVSSFKCIERLNLAHVHACSWIKSTSPSWYLCSWWLYPTHACTWCELILMHVYYCCRSLSWSLPNLFLAFTCTKWEYCVCIQFHKPQKLFHMSPPYLPICGIYLPFQVNLYVPNSKPSNEVLFCMLE